MIRKSLLAALAFGLASTLAQAQTEISLWHSMTGALGDKLNEIAGKFNASQKDYKVVPVYKLMKDADEKFDPKVYMPAVAGYYTDYKGQMLSFPFNSSTPVFYVNKDAFKKAGLNPDQAPKTWEEAIDPKWNGALPYTLLVEPGGKIVYSYQGPVDLLELKRAIVEHPLMGRYY